MKRERILAVDYGAKNVGLACSDQLGVTVRPLVSIPNRGRRRLLVELKSAVQEHDIGELVVGIPLNMDGSSGDAARNAEHFIETLHSELGLPLKGIDERLSTLEALELWKSMSSKQRRRYRTVDSLAAALILERYLQES